MKGLIASLLLLTSSPAFSEELNLKGKALLEYSIFGIDLYTISYYESNSKKHRSLVLDYERDIKKEHSIEGWKVGFKQNLDLKLYEDEITWVNQNTPDMKKGERFEIIIQGETVVFKKNDEEIATSKNPKLIQIVHVPWIGQNPVDEDAKKKLLGK